MEFHPVYYPDVICYNSSYSNTLLSLQAHEIIALEILTLLLETVTDDSVEVAVGFVKECGIKLQEVSPRGIHGM